MRLSRTVFEILSLIFQKLKRSRDSDQAPFRDNLSSVGWDLLWSTCTPNLKYLATKTAERIKIPFGVINWVCFRYYVLNGGFDPTREEAILGAKRSSPLQSTGTLCGELCNNNWTDRDTVLDEYLGGAKGPCIGRGCRRGCSLGNFWELSGPVKSIGNLRCSRRCNVAVAFAAKGTRQS